MIESALLLDTHVWIWIVNEVSGKLSDRCIENVRAASREQRLLISVISVWEVAILESKNRLSLPMGCVEWVRQALGQYGVELAELAPEIAIESTRLPGNFHGDPADRILVATARYRNATLVTADRAILGYSRSRHVRAANASSQAGWP
jgi:PIN domain nuclease of toxin-antitoxin system